MAPSFAPAGQPVTALQLYERLRHIKLGGTSCKYPLSLCETLAPQINRINALKAANHVVILAHSYVSPEIIYGVADYVGDSYKLAQDARASNAQQLIFAAVRFMAETAKLLNPTKPVYLPASDGGCSLADSITADDVLALRRQYPQHAVLSYINTTAAVKAVSDVIVTSSNVYDIAERYPNDKLIFLPDKLMGENLKKELERRGVHKELVLHDGTCYVHEAYDVEALAFMKQEYGGELEVVVHPECSPAVVAGADYVGSTSQMMNYVQTSSAKQFFMVTECGLVSRLQSELTNSKKKLVGSCTLCKFMKSNTLSAIERILTHPQAADEVTVAPTIQQKARASLEAMFQYAN